MRRTLKLTALGLAAYGGYTLWSRYGSRIMGARGDGAVLSDRRVGVRSELTVTELSVGSDDPVAQATAILAESDERTELSRDEPGVEHRRSQDTVDP
jgi:hypothetical protein